jgi:hypothetical protein
MTLTGQNLVKVLRLRRIPALGPRPAKLNLAFKNIALAALNE